MPEAEMRLSLWLFDVMQLQIIKAGKAGFLDVYGFNGASPML